MKNTISIFLLTTFISVVSSQAQDIHFSQYFNTPMNLSPALTGLFDGDDRFNASYRNQWQNVPVAYNTFSGAYDHRFFNAKSTKDFFGIGGHFFHDQAGDSRLSTSRLSLAGTYTRRLGKSNFLTLGAMAGIAQRAFHTADLRFDSQWDGHTYNPGLSAEHFSNTNIVYPTFSLGLNYGLTALTKRSRLNLGAGLFHINEPDVCFDKDTDDPLVLPRRLSLYGMGAIQATQAFDVIGKINYQLQGPHSETVANLTGRMHLNQEFGKHVALDFGVSYRFGDRDAFVPVVGLMYRQWQFGFSYDVNTSDFTEASNNNGGPEFSMMYIIKKVRPEERKVCPPYL